MGTKVTEKINIRNPFYITADGEGAPDLPATESDPVDDPDVPVDYVEPAQVTQTVLCGETVNIGEDVGVKTYKLNVGKATGNVTVNYTVNVPVSIVGLWNAPVPGFQATGYVGNDSFEQDLIDAGIGNTSGLGSGPQTGTVTINKTAETPEDVNFVVSAPLRTDDYELTFNCPTAPSITAPAGNVPSTIPSHTGFFEQIPAFYIQMDDNFGGDNDFFDLQLKVNGVVVVSEFTSTGWYVFSDYDGVQTNFGVHQNVAAFGGSHASSPAKNQGYTITNNCISAWSTPTTFYAQSDYFTTDLNKIEFIYTLKDTKQKWPIGFSSNNNSAMRGTGQGPYVRFVKSGLFYDTVDSVWRYPINSQRDASQFDWKNSTNFNKNMQNNDTVFVGTLAGVESTINPYQGRNEFSNYGTPVKYTKQFFWRSTPTAGLDNPSRNIGTKTIGSTTYAPASAGNPGRTYKILLDDGAGFNNGRIIPAEFSTTNTAGYKGCFS